MDAIYHKKNKVTLLDGVDNMGWYKVQYEDGFVTILHYTELTPEPTSSFIERYLKSFKAVSKLLLPTLLILFMCSQASAGVCWKEANKDGQERYEAGIEYYYCKGFLRWEATDHAWIKEWTGERWKIIDSNTSRPSRDYFETDSWVNGYAKEVKGGMIYKRR